MDRVTLATKAVLDAFREEVAKQEGCDPEDLDFQWPAGGYEAMTEGDDVEAHGTV